jgi:general L-amino acid transport system permease protein
LLYDPQVRSVVVQAVLLIAIVAFFAWVTGNVVDNLRRANIVSGFGFLDERAGFEISQSFIPYSVESTYGRALLVGIVNTLVVAVIGIVLATILGFVAGIARISGNWLIARIATVYIETFRNVPVLLQLLFWYRAVLAVLPGPRQGYALPLGANLNIRGLFLPRPVLGPETVDALVALAVAIVAVIALALWARRRQEATGRSFPTIRVALALLVGLPVLAFLLTGTPLTFDYPELKGFNFVGGMHVKPEIMALILGLVLYTATFIAEVVRAGILAVDRGQTEAAYAVGLRRGDTLRLVVVPQALRVMIPPLTNQYLNLTKNSSLAVAVGYPDLVSIFAGTVLNQTGQAIEAVTITMLVYLAISLATSLLMNRFNRRIALVER